MENLLETIRTAVRDDADPDARRAGMAACREIIAILELVSDDEPTEESTGSSSSVPAPAPASTASSEPAPASAPPAPASAPPPPAPAPAVDPAAVATLLASLGTLPPEQLLDLAIARLRAALPPGVDVSPPATPLRFQIVPLHLERSK